MTLDAGPQEDPPPVPGPRLTDIPHPAVAQSLPLADLGGGVQEEGGGYDGCWCSGNTQALTYFTVFKRWKKPEKCRHVCVTVFHWFSQYF